jgi:hypothetical protein
MAPVMVTSDNELEVFNRLFPAEGKPTGGPTKTRFKVGDEVRVSLLPEKYGKAHNSQWSEAVYTVKEILNSSPLRYKLAEFDGNVLEGSFYAEEMAKSTVPFNESRILKIDKVLKKRSRRGVKEVLVSYRNYPPKANRWIPQSDLMPI